MLGEGGRLGLLSQALASAVLAAGGHRGWDAALFLVSPGAGPSTGGEAASFPPFVGPLVAAPSLGLTVNVWKRKGGGWNNQAVFSSFKRRVCVRGGKEGPSSAKFKFQLPSFTQLRAGD